MFTCACVDVDEPVVVMSEGFVKGRKEYTCIECKKPIIKGQRHYVENTIDEGKYTIYRTCEFCKKIRDEFFDCGWFYGNMWDDFVDVNLDNGDNEEDETRQDVLDWVGI